MANASKVRDADPKKQKHDSYFFKLETVVNAARYHGDTKKKWKLCFGVTFLASAGENRFE